MRLKFTRQFDQMDCGPSCIRMVASAYGKDYPLSYLRTLAHLTREGVSVAGIRDALKEIGMESATFQMTLEQLEDKCPLPAILHWEQNHFVVLYKITRNRFTRRPIYHIADEAKDIEVSHLTFSYTGSIGQPALQDITLRIPKGKTTAIVGESGSGKTTLMKLLLKFYTPAKGTITLDGHDLGIYSAKSLRLQCGIVMQDNFVFSDTIRQNIILGEPYDPRRFEEAIRMACLTDYVDKLPLRDFTKIGRDGVGISGGEKQRIMIARAIYKRPHYIMLDEATSSLDAENEQRITDNMAAIFRHHTVVVIAHRLSTVKNADNIIVLKQGRIVEQGDHQTLAAQRGYYYSLVKNQMELAK